MTGRRPARSARATWITLGVFLALALALLVLPAVVDTGSSDGDAASTTTTTAAPTSSVDPRTAEVRRWEEGASAAFQPLTGSAFELPRQAREWLDGTRTDDEFRADVTAAFADVLRVRDAVAALDELAPAPLADDLYEASALLYVEYVRLDLVALDLEPGDVRDQTVLAARRVRILADRVFDRGRALMAPLLDEAPDPNVEVNLPRESPDWVAEGVAAGPPLAAPPPEPDGPPPLLEEERPTQPRADWTAAVAAVPIPPAGEVAGSIEAVAGGRLGTVAQQLDDAVRALEPIPDPEGGREDATRARLALLVHEEAARAAQLGSVTDGDERLDRIARRLALVGDDLWATTGLLARRTGFDRALLGGEDP